jgi:hypothetical protein
MEHFLRQNKTIIGLGLRPCRQCLLRCSSSSCRPATFAGVLFLVVVYQRGVAQRRASRFSSMRLDKPPFYSGSQNHCQLACILLVWLAQQGETLAIKFISNILLVQFVF